MDLIKTIEESQRKAELENLLTATFMKAQTKAQEIVSEKTKDIL